MTLATLREKLEAGKPAFGAIVTFSMPEVVELFSLGGYDWLNIETEHSAFTVRDVQNILEVADRTGIFPAVRVIDNDPILFKQFLDIGTSGFIVPMVSSRQEAENAVRACRYPPNGIRGFGPRRASAYGTRNADYFKTIDSELMIVPMIETKEAVENIDDILSVEGFDTFLIGGADLSISLGTPLDYFSEKSKDAVAKVLRASKKAGKFAGTASMDPVLVRKYIADGFQFILAGGDYYFILDHAREFLKKVKEPQ